MSDPLKQPIKPLTGHSSAATISATLARARSKDALLMNPSQSKNPMLRYIRHVRTEFHSGISVDFVCGPTTGVLYLTLQYHQLHPNYIYSRIRNLQPYRLKVLLVVANTSDTSATRTLCKLGVIQDLTVIMAGCEREAARYLETFRCYAGKGSEMIQGRAADEFGERMEQVISSVRGVNKTDVQTLLLRFGSLKGVSEVDETTLRSCPGMGGIKSRRLFAALHQPFRKDGSWEEDGAES